MIAYGENNRRPVLTIEAPATATARDVTIENATTGKSLTLIVPGGWGGEDLILDFEAQTIKDGTGADRSSLLDPEDTSLWIREPLIAGANELKLSAAQGVTSTTKSPGTMATHGGAGVAWTNPNNAKASDNTYATTLLEDGAPTSETLDATNFGFGIPETASIVAWEPRVERKGSDPEIVKDLVVKLIKAGVLAGANKAAAAYWADAENVVAYGGVDEGWEIDSLAPADVNNAGFGFAISAERKLGKIGTAEIDFMELTVYWRAAKGAYAVKAVLTSEPGYH